MKNISTKLMGAALMALALSPAFAGIEPGQCIECVPETSASEPGLLGLLAVGIIAVGVARARSKK